MPTIRVDEDVFVGLQKIAQPFTDTPNSVIKRLLEEAGVMPKTPSARVEVAATKPVKAVPGGKLVPQPTYERYLLHVLAREFKGRGHKHEVSKVIIEKMERRGLLSELEHKMMQTGETRAENTIAWGRNALKERGLLSASSPRGIWELTEAGMEEGLRTEI
jgi:hypothetical protein